jgi:heat-inducible transcriptional repressor
MAGVNLTPRQELVLRKVVNAHQVSGLPVGSKALAADPDFDCGPSTVRNELAVLEEYGLLAHPHTSAGRVPTDAGHRYYVDRLLPGVLEPGGGARPEPRPLELQLIRREVDEAMRVTTETLSQVTNLLAIVSAPPINTATIRHIEVLLLQPQVVMVVVITSTGGVTKRVFGFESPVDAGLVTWAAEELNGRLVGVGLGARTLRARLGDPSRGATERRFLEELSPAFTDLAATAEDSLYVDGAARLLTEHRVQDLTQINELMEMLERRVTLLGVPAGPGRRVGRATSTCASARRTTVPALRALGIAAGYGLPAATRRRVRHRPVRRTTGAIRSVRDAPLTLTLPHH